MHIAKKDGTKVLCPLCNRHSSYLGGKTTKKYFCFECSIEFTVIKKSSKDIIGTVHEVGAGGSIDEIQDWWNYKMP